MIDERQEELAALYALDLLEGADRAQFEAALARDPALQALVRDLRESSAALAHTAPAAPPPAALRERVLTSIGERATTAVGDNVSRPPASLFRSLTPWAVAAGFAAVAAFDGLRYVSSRGENATLRQQLAVTDVAWQTAQTTLAAERVVSQRQLATITDTNRQLADATRRSEALASERATIDQALATTREQLASRERELAAARAQAGESDHQLLALAQRIESLTRAGEEAQRRLAAAEQAVDQLDRELRGQASVADMKIATLTSMLKNSPQALAVALWDPKKHEGVVTFEKLPALAANQSFELWVIENREGAKPVSAGVFLPNSDGSGRVAFKPTAAVATVGTFAVSREQQDGAAAHAAPGEVVMLGKSK